MDGQRQISRRGLLGTAAALGAASVVGRTPAARADAGPVLSRPLAQLPPRGELVIRNAYVLTMDPALGDLARGDVHVRGGDIVAVGTDLAAPAAEVLDGRDMIVLPGLIDAHFHLWNSTLRNLVQEGPELGYFPLVLGLGRQYTPEDMYRGVRLGVAELLYGGVTTVHDWAHNIRGPAHADADLRALMDSGIRARFSYGTPQGGPPPDESMDLADLARMHREWGSRAGDGLLMLGMAARSLSVSARGAVTVEALQRDWAAARELGLPITIHTGSADSVTLLDQAGLLGPDVQLINASRYDDAARSRVADSGTHVNLSPLAELRTSFASSRLPELLAQGILVSLSVDTPAVSGNSDMFAHMHVLLDLQFTLAGDPLSVSARQILELATINGARDLGIADRVGSLTPGKRADLILVRTTDLNMAPLGDAVTAIVRSAQPYNVDTVIVDGRILKRGGQLTALDAEQVVREAAESLAALRARAGAA
jgi:5-methylthioadenosine/S-adenosylhomocysteine deaminase